jgi:hypothetical protein
MEEGRVSKQLFNATKICDCGNPKLPALNFCTACWLSLPAKLRADLHRESAKLFALLSDCKAAIAARK